MSRVRWKHNKVTNNIKIINSTKLTKKEDIKNFLVEVPLGLVNRTDKSALNEWIAHNRLYKLGLFKNRTKDCDITQGESLFRRICYWILSRGAK